MKGLHGVGESHESVLLLRRMTYVYGQRDLFLWNTRLISMEKEAYFCAG